LSLTPPSIKREIVPSPFNHIDYLCFSEKISIFFKRMASDNMEKIRKFFGHKFPRWGPLGYRWFLRNHPADITTELFPGIHLSLNLKDEAQRTFYYYGDRYEYPTGPVLASWCQNATLFFDIGANFGFFSLLLRSKNNPLDIIAFEPNPIVNQRLRQILAENKIQNVTVEDLGLSSTKAVLPLHPGQENNGQSTFGNHPGLCEQTVAHVEVMPFDSYCDSRNLRLPSKPEWVAKIDVEGFDLKVLEGMKMALKKRAFIGISVEVNEYNLGFCGTTPSALRAHMNDNGYRALLSSELPGGKKSTDNEFYVPS
jgi:FkbM family methyltransferase